MISPRPIGVTDKKERAALAAAILSDQPSGAGKRVSVRVFVRLLLARFALSTNGLAGALTA